MPTDQPQATPKWIPVLMDNPAFNWRWLGVLVVVTVSGALIYSDYGVPGALFVIPFLMPMLVSVFVFLCSHKLYMRFIVGLGALTAFDVIRWLAWVGKVGSEFAVGDEQTFGIARATAAVHVLVFVVSVGIGLVWEIKSKHRAEKSS